MVGTDYGRKAGRNSCLGMATQTERKKFRVPNTTYPIETPRHERKSQSGIYLQETQNQHLGLHRRNLGVLLIQPGEFAIETCFIA